MENPSTVQYVHPEVIEGHYVYLFTIDAVPVYVGNGQKNRLWQHERSALHHKKRSQWQRHLATALKSGKKVVATVLQDGLSNAEARDFEIRVIALVGRKDLKAGPLLNLTCGGDGLNSEDAKRLFAQPNMKVKLAKGAARRMRDPVERAKLAVSHKRSWDNPEIRARRVAINRATLSRPEVRAKRECQDFCVQGG